MQELVLRDQPASWREWWADLVSHREVLGILVRKDFQTRYKRASFGILWAVAVPVLQGLIMAVVFDRVLAERVDGGTAFAAFVMSGILAWSYFGASLQAATTAIVDGASLTDKVWFPRVLLVVVPCLANLVGLVVSYAVFIAVLPLLDADIGLRLFFLVPAMLLLIGFTVSLSLVLSALYVYFRDVRFLVLAAMLVWLYVTPVLYPKSLLGGLGDWIDLNPMTGVVALFQSSAVPGVELGLPVTISVAITVLLLAVGLNAQRTRDRLFVDLL